jgi:hypothetical protein
MEVLGIGDWEMGCSRSVGCSLEFEIETDAYPIATANK